jgi:hypothetical protein
MELEPADLRKIKQALQEAVQEADTAVKASLPSLEEVEKIKEAFDLSLGQVANMIKPSPTPSVCRRDPSDN